MRAAAVRRTPAMLGARGVRHCGGEIGMLQQLLKEAQIRATAAQKSKEASAASADDASERFQIQTFNAISPVGLRQFPPGQFLMTGGIWSSARACGPRA